MEFCTNLIRGSRPHEFRKTGLPPQPISLSSVETSRPLMNERDQDGHLRVAHPGKLEAPFT